MKGYGQFCPVAKASEIFGERWTPLIIRELMAGSHRFNEIRRGNPLMSPSLLSQRLKYLESVDVIERRASGDGSDTAEYYLTPAGEELVPIIMKLGNWGMRWAKSRLTSEDYDPALLMWDMRRRIDGSRFPEDRTVVSFEFYDAPAKSRFWFLVVDRGEVDMCLKNPGYDIDLQLRTRIRVMAEIWMGRQNLKQQVKDGGLQVTGSPALKRSLDSWLGYNVFAAQAS